jgi:hypothetical protein
MGLAGSQTVLKIIAQPGVLLEHMAHHAPVLLQRRLESEKLNLCSVSRSGRIRPCGLVAAASRKRRPDQHRSESECDGTRSFAA